MDGGSLLLLIGSLIKKNKLVLLIVSSSSSSSPSLMSLISLLSSSTLLSLLIDQALSSFTKHTYRLVVLGILIGGNSNNDNSNNNQTTHSSLALEGVASFVSSELIDAAAKIIQYSSLQQCLYSEALEYVGVPRDYANTEECKSRLRKKWCYQCISWRS